jgi:hypothetical protein
MLPYIDRPLFFDNQVLGEEDLHAIVAYVRDRDRRHALGQHVWGIVFGLHLLEETEADGTVACLLTPGIAVDGYGRLIVVERPFRVPETLLRDQIDPLVPLWIGYEEEQVADTRPGFNDCCRSDDMFRRAREGFRLIAGRLNSVRDRHDGIVASDEEVEDPRLFATLADPTAALLCDGSIPVQEMAERRPVPRWWVPLGHAGWTPGAPGRFREMTENERIAGRPLRRYAGLVTEDILSADGMIRLRRRETVRPPGASVDDACAATRLTAADLTVVDGKVQPIDLISLEGDTRALGQVKLFGTRLELRRADGTDAAVPLYLRRGIDAGGESIDVVLGEDEDPANRLAIGVATDFGDIVAHVVVKADGRVGIGALQPGDYAADANRLVIEADEPTGLTIATPSAATGAILFADGTAAAEASQGQIRYDHARDVMLFGSDGSIGAALDHNGRFGIGTETPVTGLQVLTGSDANLSNNSGYVVIGDVGGRNIVLDDNEMMARNAGAASPLHFQANGGDVVVHQNVGGGTQVAITDAGRLGLGTTAPATQLHLRGDDPDVLLDMNGGSPNQLCEIRFAQDGAVGARVYWNRNDGRIYLVNDGATAATLENGNLGLGLGGGATAQGRLHVRDSKDAPAINLDAHVAVIENVSTGANADVLALRVAAANPGAANNFITFFSGAGAIGAIEGDGNGITLNTAGADFAEALSRADTTEAIMPGNVVGVTAGRISRVTAGADTVLVTTSRPAVLGNAGVDVADRVGVTLIGQAPVRVRGSVRAGDLLRASGHNDGTAVAIAGPPSPADLVQLVGRAWTAHDGSGEGEVVVAVNVGDAQAAAARAWAEDRAALRRLEGDVAELRRLLTESLPARGVGADDA